MINSMGIAMLSGFIVARTPIPKDAPRVRHFFINVAADPAACKAVMAAINELKWSFAPRRCPATVGIERVIVSVNTATHAIEQAGILTIHNESEQSVTAEFETLLARVHFHGLGLVTRQEWDDRERRRTEARP